MLLDVRTFMRVAQGVVSGGKGRENGRTFGVLCSVLLPQRNRLVKRNPRFSLSSLSLCFLASLKAPLSTTALFPTPPSPLVSSRCSPPLVPIEQADFVNTRATTSSGRPCVSATEGVGGCAARDGRKRQPGGSQRWFRTGEDERGKRGESGWSGGFVLDETRRAADAEGAGERPALASKLFLHLY